MRAKIALFILLIFSVLTLAAEKIVAQTESSDSSVLSTAPKETPSENRSEILPSVTISELQARVLATHPAIAALDERIAAANGETLQASLPYNPTIGYMADDLGTPGAGSGKQGIVFSQEIRTAGKRSLARNAGAWEVETLTHERETVAQGVANEVRCLAYRLLAARRLATVRENLEKLAAETEKQGEALRAAGEMSVMNLLQLTVQKNTAAMAAKTAVMDRTAAERELAALLGEEILSFGEISDPLEGPLDEPLPEESVLLAAILANTPAMRQAEAAVEQKRAALSLETANSRPNVSAEGNVHYDSGEKTTLAAAGISVPLQIFDRNQGAIQKAQAEVQAAMRDAERLRLGIAQKAARVYRNGETARQEALTYRDEILPALKKSYEMNFQGFRLAQIGFLEMSNSQTVYFEASAAYVESLLRLSEAVALLDGMLLENDEPL